MQEVFRTNSFGIDGRRGRSVSSSRVNKALIAAGAIACAASIAVNPLTANVGAEVHHTVAAEIQHREVLLTAGIGDVVGAYEGVLTQAGANLQTLASEGQVAIPEMLTAIGTNLSGYGDLISTGLTGAAASLQNAFYGGWYGGDDGYVFGLFGGSVTHNGVTESGSTLQLFLGALQQGKAFDAFGYIEPWALELIDHTLKPLLSPFLNTAKAGAIPSATIPGEVLQTLSSVAASFLSYPMLKAVAKTVMAPALSVAFGFFGDIDTISGDFSSGNLAKALTDVLEVPAHFAGNLLNGYVLKDPVLNPTGAPFTGLLNTGSLLEDLVKNWPHQLAVALTPTKAVTAATSAAVVSSKVAPATSAVTPSVAKDSTASKDAHSSDHHQAGASHTASTSTKAAGEGHSHRSHSASSHSSGS
ncbi:hypothetical protein ACTXG7_27575 [Mycolicibacterium sp. Dal123E01]|uniref:hypothetical protein n=1 Tax=Mycolicibacterium sp. Dal123E01 TaxID=3457578 RepID=UPI00403E42B7